MGPKQGILETGRLPNDVLRGRVEHAAPERARDGAEPALADLCEEDVVAAREARVARAHLADRAVRRRAARALCLVLYDAALVVRVPAQEVDGRQAQCLAAARAARAVEHARRACVAELRDLLEFRARLRAV
jgi:hypothetical protein